MSRYIINRPDFYSSVIDDPNTGPAVWRRLNQRIFKDCVDVWEAVKEVLCIDSPEGHGFEEDEMDGLDIGTKDTLSFSWRALKEARLAPGSDCVPDLLLTRFCL